MDKGYLRTEGDKVFFDYAEVFKSGECDCFHGEFEGTDYRKGIESMALNGSCKVPGKGCLMDHTNPLP